MYFIQKEQALDQLTEFLTCQGMGYVPVILPKDMEEDKKTSTDTKITVQKPK